jgi:predicted regulator of Ras-like GTPase activity (Roadblock/LC7/MglB family)
MKSGPGGIGFLGSDDVRAFEELLAAYIGETRARCALLLDRAGRVLTSAGDLHDFDQTTFASLASADFSASDQLAALLGEEEFSSLYHHGAACSMFLADVDGAAILAVIFDADTTLGMVRIRTRTLLPRLAEALDRLAQHGPTGQVVQMEADWAAEAETEIDRLFNG